MSISSHSIPLHFPPRSRALVYLRTKVDIARIRDTAHALSPFQDWSLQDQCIHRYILTIKWCRHIPKDASRGTRVHVVADCNRASTVGKTYPKTCALRSSAGASDVLCGTCRFMFDRMWQREVLPTLRSDPHKVSVRRLWRELPSPIKFTPASQRIRKYKSAFGRNLRILGPRDQQPRV